VLEIDIHTYTIKSVVIHPHGHFVGVWVRGNICFKWESYPEPAVTQHDWTEIWALHKTEVCMMILEKLA
jgi:hypothetical protein